MTEHDSLRPRGQNDALAREELVDMIPTSGPLIDSYGRWMRSMRISITDKCNFRCTYCMPAEGLPWLSKAEILSYEEIARIARIAVDFGIEHIRLTGGEPLVRRDVPELVGQLKRIEGLRSLSITTNGLLLKQQTKA